MHFPGEGSSAVFEDIELEVVGQGVLTCLFLYTVNLR